MSYIYDVKWGKLSKPKWSKDELLYKPLLHFSHFLRKVVSTINVSILCVNITKLSFVCMCIKFDHVACQISVDRVKISQKVITAKGLNLRGQNFHFFY